MTRFIGLVLLFLALEASGFGQTKTPTPTQTPEPLADDVVKINTSLIQLDVTVVDKAGKIIKDLKKDEIEVYENGRKQDLTAFSFVSGIRETTLQPVKPTADRPLPPADLKSEQIRRVVALVVDDLSLSFQSTYFVKRALKKFVDEQMQPGDLVAIIRTGAGIGALQQFTNDRRLLYAAIDKLAWNSYANGRIGSFAPMSSGGGVPVDSSSEDDGTDPDPSAVPEANEAEAFRESVFTAGTLGAVSYIVKGMNDLPGRKSVVLLSEGFAITERNSSGFEGTGRVFDALTQLVDAANRASVVIYTLDPRGLQPTGLTAEDDVGEMTAEAQRRAISARGRLLADTQDGLRYLAKETGGRALLNSNDLSGSIRKILDDQSYYLIAYEPNSDTFDPNTRRFNNISIKLLRPGASAQYRSGFFSTPDKASGPSAASGPQGLYEALMSPFAVNNIPLRLNGVFANDPKTGEYVRTLTYIGPDAVKFTTLPDGSHQAVLDVVAAAFGANGEKAESVSRSYTIKVADAAYNRLLRSGFVYDLAFPIRKPGAYQLRIVIRDQTSQMTGSANQFIDIPDLKNKRLTLSGIALRNVPADAASERSSLAPDTASRAKDAGDPLVDTSLRRFKSNSILDYGFLIYNARKNGAAPAELTSQIRLYRDGKMVFEGVVRPVADTAAREDAVTFGGSLRLGKTMPLGEYILQIEITDKNAKGKHRTAVQFVQFEVVN